MLKLFYNKLNTILSLKNKGNTFLVISSKKNIYYYLDSFFSSNFMDSSNFIFLKYGKLVSKIFPKFLCSNGFIYLVFFENYKSTYIKAFEKFSEFSLLFFVLDGQIFYFDEFKKYYNISNSNKWNNFFFSLWQKKVSFINFYNSLFFSIFFKIKYLIYKYKNV